jgi:Ca-activated chloride channel family protein
MQGYLSWTHPQWLQLLWLLLPAGWLVWVGVQWRQQALAVFLGAQYRAADWRWHRRRRLLRGALVLSSVALVVVALGGPQVGTEVRRARRVGADVVLVIDTSDSMLARDVPPNRLEAARNAALSLVAQLPGDRFGVVVFAGSAYLYAPLTTDHELVGNFLSAIERGSAPAPGTAIGGALQAAVDLLRSAESRNRAIVLFTDGEDHEGANEAAAAQALAAGIHVHAVGLGSVEGETIPLPEGEDSGEEGQLSGPEGAVTSSGPRLKHDTQGRIVVTRLNADFLEKLAHSGGGVFVRSSRSGVSVDRVAQAILSQEAGVESTYEYSQRAEQFQWPLGMAIVLSAMELLLATARWPKRGGADGR